MNWVIIADLLRQLKWNLVFDIFQFDCVSNFESSQALSERGEDTVVRDRRTFPQQKFKKAGCQAVTNDIKRSEGVLKDQ